MDLYRRQWPVYHQRNISFWFSWAYLVSIDYQSIHSTIQVLIRNLEGLLKWQVSRWYLGLQWWSIRDGLRNIVSAPLKYSQSGTCRSNKACYISFHPALLNASLISIVATTQIWPFVCSSATMFLSFSIASMVLRPLLNPNCMSTIPCVVLKWVMILFKVVSYILANPLIIHKGRSLIVFDLFDLVFGKFLISIEWITLR